VLQATSRFFRQDLQRQFSDTLLADRVVDNVVGPIASFPIGSIHQKQAAREKGPASSGKPGLGMAGNRLNCVATGKASKRP
jgi:hypothetical protein